MATLTQLYTRLILDTNRDDMGSGGELEQAKIDAVVDAIEKNADELYWFNRKTGTVSTTASTATVALPTGMRIPLVVTYLGAELQKVRLEEVEAAVNVSSPITGPPSKWAEDGGTIHLYPTPDAVYVLGVYGIADLGVPASSASNAWTTEAYDLILGEAKVILCRGPLRDPDGLALAKDGREEALTKLRRETRRRGNAPMTTDIPVPQAYNILTG
jgi:hypothetical protein